MGPEIDASALKTERLIKDTLRSEYTRGWNDGLEQARMLLATDTALSGTEHKAVLIALDALKRRVSPSEGNEP